jgi:hypothetical protein
VFHGGNKRPGAFEGLAGDKNAKEGQKARISLSIHDNFNER